MLNELLTQIRKYDMVQSGDEVVCAVSGGADSMALLWGMYLLRDKLGFRLSAAHFNHHLRGEESLRDERFVREFCDRFAIPLHLGGGEIKPGKKGLEAAAREARYAFFATLPGKIATAHTANDNAETVLLHLVRGTGLKGLGAIAPVNGRLIRPMLTVSREQVLAFLAEYHIFYVEDSSNGGDAFLRNRLRHHVMPLLKAENPRLAENLSQMAMSLRQDEAALSQLAQFDELPEVSVLREQPEAVRRRMIEAFLKQNGVREPEREHMALVERLIFSPKPSAKAELPGGITVSRCYERLEVWEKAQPLAAAALPADGQLELAGWQIRCEAARDIVNTQDTFTVVPMGEITIRSRMAGDEMRLPGGTKQLKKLFIDRKIPAADRARIPVICDNAGVLGVAGIGVNQDRAAKKLPAVRICCIKK